MAPQIEAIDQLLDCYGMVTPESRVAADAAGAAEAAETSGAGSPSRRMGPELLHKTDLGAVRVGLAGGEEVAQAAEEIDEMLAPGRS